MAWIQEQKISEKPILGLPQAYANVIIAGRFGKWPEECEERPTDRALFYDQILFIEGRASKGVEGLSPGDEIIEYR